MNAQVTPQNGGIVILIARRRHAIDLAAKTTANGSGFGSDRGDHGRRQGISDDQIALPVVIRNRRAIAGATGRPA
jgi:hypothetical protein